ncbi:MAG: zinc dependent phospholipase C family protein [Gemmatimonadota bacterium]
MQLLVGVLLVALTPADALAWTPGTHVFIGESLLGALHLLPQNIAGLLASFPNDFLYGSIAADTSIAKKYAAAGRHCHSWRVGFEILERSGDEPLRAFSLGYLAHLAADVVAHNYFVPRQLTVTSSTSALGHSYWEARFELHLGDGPSRKARELILLDHGRADGHLDRILSPTIFSTPTNRRIFRGMVRVTDMESWQRIFQMAGERSRWDLSNDEVEQYLVRSFDYVVDLLHRFDRAEPFAFDPSGQLRLRLAKRVRREALRVGGPAVLAEHAERHFGMPHTSLSWSAQLGRPVLSLLPARRPAEL